MSTYQASLIQAGLSNEVRNHLADIRIFETIPSTNQYLLEHCRELPNGTLCLAECQSAGQGRREKKWQSPTGNLYLSLLWTVPISQDMGLLPLMVAVSLCQCLGSYGVQANVKWPNDIWVQNKKIAGILIESKIKKNKVVAIIGIGLNIQSNRELQNTVKQPWTSLDQVRIKSVEKNALVASIINQLIPILLQLGKRPEKEFWNEWIRYDLVCGKWIKILSDSSETTGIARGVSDSGRLRVEVGKQMIEYSSGEVSIQLPV